jgi:hypothetical protein
LNLKRFGLILAGLLIIALVVIVTPVSATVVTISNTTGALAAAIGAAGPGDTILLNPGTYFEHGLTISQDITLRANTSYGGTAADTIIDGSNIQIITVNSGCNLLIDDLTLENGVVTGSGGAIYNGGTLTVTSSTFTDCTAHFTGGGGGTGGAIDNAGTITRITSTSFSDCTAIYGGAIYNDNGGTIASITTTSFTDCYANGGGDAIYNAGTITSITTSTFNRDSAGGYYAIYNAGTIAAPDNWWGTNTPDFSNLIGGAPAPTFWLMLGITASPSSITMVQTSRIQANLTFNSTGFDTSASGYVPDGIPVAFAVVSGPGSGTFTPSAGNITTGANTTTFTPTAPGIAEVNATVDGQQVNTFITILLGPPITSIGAITGSPIVGQTLANGTVMPAGATVAIQWNESASINGPYSPISGATSYTYVLQTSDLGKYIEVNATGTGSYSGFANSTPVGPVTTATPTTSPTTPAPVHYGHQAVGGGQPSSSGSSGYIGPAPTRVSSDPASMPQPVVVHTIEPADPPTTLPPLPTNTPRSGIDAVPVIGALGLCGAIVLSRKNGK